MVVAAVEGRKLGRPKKHKPGEAPGRKKIALTATTAYADWIEEGAAYCRLDVSKLIDSAVVEYLRARGFTKPPPPRY